jgi:DNA-binding beta-propeller fold protein YncE
MKLGGYNLDLAHRIEPAVGATWVGKRDTLLVARETPENQYELELIRLDGFKTIARKTVKQVATVTRAGERWVLLMLPADLAAQDTKQPFELRAIDDLEVAGSFVEDTPGYVAVYPDGSRVAVGHEFAGLNIWDAHKGELLASVSAKGTGGIAWSHDGALLAVKEFGGSLKIFDSGNIGDKPLRSVKLGREPAIVFHPSEATIAAAEKSEIQIVDASTGKLGASIPRPKESGGSIHRIVYSPDGRLLATSSLGKFVVALWDAEKHTFLGKVRDFNIPIAGVEFDDTGKYLMIASFAEVEIYSVA